MIKTILLDIDGTLVNNEKVITPKTKEALLKAQSQGVRLAIASGRPDMGLYKWGRELEMDQHGGIFICFNGARVIDCQTGEELYSKTMAAEDAKEVLRHMQQFNVTPMVCHGEYMHTTDVFGGVIPYRGQDFNLVSYEARSNEYLLCEHRDMAEWVNFPVNKVLTAGEPAYLQEHFQEMQAPFQDRLSCMFTADFFFEFTAKDVNKATAIEMAYRNLGITREEMIAFGDAENDLPMLRYAGIGVAMGNAMESVKAAADEITLDNNHDGIAVALEKHGII